MSIPGLPGSLPDVARRYAEALPKGTFSAFPLTALDRTGVCAWEVSLFLDDQAAFPGAMPSGYGYGETDDEALIGAIAEMAEMICPTLRLIDEPRRIGSYQDLVREVGATGITDPLTLCLPAGSPVDHRTPLAWIEAVRARTGERVLVPMDVGALDDFELPPGYRPFTTLITNGLGAGPDVDWALGHGLLECLQRDGNGLLFRALDQGVVLDLPSGLEPGTRRLLDRLDQLGIEVQVKYATDEFGLANLYVVGFEREGFEPPVPIMLSACGEACDPDRDRALRKALLEFCSARVRKAYSHGPRAVAERAAPHGPRRTLPAHGFLEPRARGGPGAFGDGELGEHDVFRAEARPCATLSIPADPRSVSRTFRRLLAATPASAGVSPATGSMPPDWTSFTWIARPRDRWSAWSRRSCRDSRSRR